MIFALLASNLRFLGPHKVSTLCMGLGFLCLAVGEFWHFINHYILYIDPYNAYIRLIYVMPSAFFALNETLFIGYKLSGRRRDLSFVFVNSFCASILGFLYIYKFYMMASGEIDSWMGVSYLLFI